MTGQRCYFDPNILRNKSVVRAAGFSRITWSRTLIGRRLVTKTFRHNLFLNNR